MKRDVTRTGLRAGTRTPDARTHDNTAAPVRTLHARHPTPLLVTGAIAAVVTLVSSAEIVTTLVGRPLHEMVPLWAHLPEAAECWAAPEMMLASSLLAAVGLTLVVLSLVPARGDWLALCDDRVRPADGVPRPWRDEERGDGR
ncbi:hypothetical protein [Nocardiopsis halotolerans]|uniref:hypothetical protein n=1 Tax=Nocardiopsis halotolerans TaxID=124252 RepID=UPI000477FDB2|nr:hypothetical protein [Nocardiopsis halotolerans]